MNAFEQDGALAKIRVAPTVAVSALHDGIVGSRVMEVRAAVRMPLAGVLKAGLDQLGLWLERGRQRRQLAELDDHLLRDIGLSRADITPECDKPFWCG